MKYFQKITSLSELKKQYRELVKNNHPDKGGDIAVMQAINNEFEQLYNIWKDRKETADTTGYANDYEGATAKEYTNNVYNEYGWTGSRRDRWYSREELKKIFAEWLKKTYKNCIFSINLGGYKGICVRLLKADFNPFIGDVKMKYSFSRYSINEDPELNERAKDMFNNIHNFCMSYNYDHSDIYTDYFDVGFYFDMEIGSGKTPFKVEISKDRRTSGGVSPEFKYKEGPVHQAIKKVLGKQYFEIITLYRGIHKGEHLVLGESYFYQDKETFHGLQYSGYKTQKNKIEKLLSVGIITECLGSYIKFIGYTPEVEKALAEEDRAKEEAYKKWQEEQTKGTAGKSDKENTAYGDGEKSLFSDGQESEKIGAFELVNYSEKAFAVVGDTREIKDLLKENGGRFNPALTVNGVKCAGWIFSKKNLDAVRIALIGFTVQDIEVNQEQPAGQPEQAERAEEQPAAEHNQQQPEHPEQADPVNNSAAYGNTEKSLIFFKSLGVLLDVLQELLTEQPKAEEKQPTPEDVAKVLEVLPALLDAVCDILKADTHTEAHTGTDTHQPHQEERTPGNNAIYNAVCSSVILTGEYTAARREIKQAIKRYRFTLPQLKYMVYILETHPGINRERLKGAA